MNLTTGESLEPSEHAEGVAEVVNSSSGRSPIF